MKKRVLSTLLCMAILLTVFMSAPITASAQETNTADTSYDSNKDSQYQKIERDGVIYTLDEFDNLIITGCVRSKLPENLVIPSEVDGYPVKMIWECAFEYAQSLVSVTIPNTIYDIEAGAFQNCENLKSVEFESGSTLKYVMEWAFRGCSSLESVVIPASLRTIGDWMFEDCKSLKSVNFENNTSLRYVGSYSFNNCESLEYFSVPASVTEIGEGAFKNCYNLSKVELHEGLEKIGQYAFYNCYSLPEIYIPETVNEIGAYALACFEYEGDIYSDSRFVVVGSPDSLADEYAEAYMVTWEYGLPAPVLKSIANTADGVKLTFEKLSGVSGQYRVYRKTAGTSWTALANITTDTYLDKTAVAGTYYTYTAKFIGSDGAVSRYDKTGLSITRLVVPSVTKIQNTEDGVKLTISKVDGAAYYRVFYKTDSGWKGIDNTDTTTFVHSDAQSGQSYTYTVRAYDENGSSSSFNSTGWSNTFVATPQISEITAVDNGLQISWGKVEGAVNYRVFVKTDTGWKGLGNTTSTTFVHTDIEEGKKYTYTVRCMTADGKTAVSDYDKEGKNYGGTDNTTLEMLRSKVQALRKTLGKLDGATKYSTAKPRPSAKAKALR